MQRRRQIVVYVSRDIFEKIKTVAGREDKSVSEYIRNLIIEDLKVKGILKVSRNE